MNKLVSLFFQLARNLNDLSKLGSISKMARRGANKLIGRRIGPKLFVKGKGGKRGWR